jgi:hypothetical protein
VIAELRGVRRVEMVRPRLPMWKRLVRHTELDHETGCWLWMGQTDLYGYALLNHADHASKLTVHRLTFEMKYGELADGEELHHVCRVRRCVNPKHLEKVGRLAHLEIHAGDQRECCPWGHVYAEVGWYVEKHADGSTTRRCKVCHKRNQHEAGLRSGRIKGWRGVMCNKRHRYDETGVRIGRDGHGYEYRICLECERERRRVRNGRSGTSA